MLEVRNEFLAYFQGIESYLYLFITCQCSIRKRELLCYAIKIEIVKKVGGGGEDVRPGGKGSEEEIRKGERMKDR